MPFIAVSNGEVGSYLPRKGSSSSYDTQEHRITGSHCVTETPSNPTQPKLVPAVMSAERHKYQTWQKEEKPSVILHNDYLPNECISCVLRKHLYNPN